MEQEPKSKARASELKGLTDRAEHLKEGFDDYNLRPVIEAAENTLFILGPEMNSSSSPTAELSHLEYMIERMRTMTDIEKANRWLGFIQGVAVAAYGVDLEKLKEINRGGL